LVFVSGYFEDRRPSSNMDPYVVTSMIAETTVLCNSNLSNGSK
jgi:glutamine synthetase